jgi:hypothetical protein
MLYKNCLRQPAYNNGEREKIKTDRLKECFILKIHDFSYFSSAF